MEHIEVVAAAIIKDKKVFVCKRPEGKYLAGHFEFPGGKIEANETCEQALKREIIEELNTKISVGKLLLTVNHDYPIYNVTLRVFECEVIEGKLELMEHSDATWCGVDDFDKLTFAPADGPIIKYLKGYLK